MKLIILIMPKIISMTDEEYGKGGKRFLWCDTEKASTIIFADEPIFFSTISNDAN